MTCPRDRWELSRALSPGHLAQKVQDALKPHCRALSLPRRMLGCVHQLMQGLGDLWVHLWGAEVADFWSLGSVVLSASSEEMTRFLEDEALG